MYAEYTPSGAYFVKYEIFSPKMKKKVSGGKQNLKSGLLREENIGNLVRLENLERCDLFYATDFSIFVQISDL